MKFTKGKLPQSFGNYNEHVWTLEFLTKADRDEAGKLLRDALKEAQREDA